MEIVLHPRSPTLAWIRSLGKPNFWEVCVCLLIFTSRHLCWNLHLEWLTKASPNHLLGCPRCLWWCLTVKSGLENYNNTKNKEKSVVFPVPVVYVLLNGLEIQLDVEWMLGASVCSVVTLPYYLSEGVSEDKLAWLKVSFGTFSVACFLFSELDIIWFVSPYNGTFSRLLLWLVWPTVWCLGYVSCCWCGVWHLYAKHNLPLPFCPPNINKSL